MGQHGYSVQFDQGRAEGGPPPSKIGGPGPGRAPLIGEKKERKREKERRKKKKKKEKKEEKKRKSEEKKKKKREGKQGRIHSIRCYETPFSAVQEKALRTDGWTDGRTDPILEVLRST